MFMKYSIVTKIYTEILINQAVDNFTSSRFRESRMYDSTLLLWIKYPFYWVTLKQYLPGSQKSADYPYQAFSYVFKLD